MTDKPDLTVCTFDELFEELAARSDSIVMACLLSADTDDAVRFKFVGDRLLGQGLIVELSDYAREVARAERRKSKK